MTGPIIGSDILSFYNLLVDVRCRRLINITTLKVNIDPAGTSGEQIKFIAGSSRYHTTLLDFPQIIGPADVPREHRHSTVHHIRTTPGPPAASRPRRLAPDRMRIAKSEFEEMPRIGTTRRSDSPWASPLHLVLKKEDMADFAHQLAFRKVFSTIGLIKAYHQIPVHPTTLLRAIITPFGLFEFPYMSFGLRNAAH